MESEPFLPVTRKKWISRKRINHKKQTSDIGYDAAETDIDVDKVQKRLDTLCEKMKITAFFEAARATLDVAIEQCDSTPKRIICLGIGPFARNYQALHQLAFIRCAQQHYGIPETLFYDPILCKAEQELLARYSYINLNENCEGKHEAYLPTIYYLPHCPHSLTNNLLWCNWRREQLVNVLLIANSFDQLCKSKPERFLRLDAEYILKVKSHMEELPLPNEIYKTSSVFNNLSLHLFPKKQLPDADDNKYWTQQQAPTYKHSELISAQS